MEGFNLGQFLEKQRQDGRQDSEGSFTVAQDKALDKMARFSLPGEFDWVLKIVQAANAWECESLQVRQTRVATSFYFCPTEGNFPTDGQIVQALKLGSTLKDGAVHELCIALRALVDQVGLSFVLATRRQEDLGSPIFFGDDVGGLSDAQRLGWARLDRPGLRLTVSHFRGNESFTGRYVPTFSRVARRSASISQILTRRAFASAVPIYLDGRDITNPFCHDEIGQTLTSRPVALAKFLGKRFEFQSYPLLCDLTRLRRPAWLNDRRAPWCILTTSDHICLEEYRKELRSSDFDLSLSRSLFRLTKHQLLWLRHGVVVQRETQFNSATCTTLHIFLHADDAPTDLTGLALGLRREDSENADKVWKLLGDSLHQVNAQLDSIARRSALHTPIAFQEKAPLPEDSKEFQAGFSIFTEGLGKLGNGSEEFIRGLQRGWRNLRARPDRSRMLATWKEFMYQELENLARDLRKERSNKK